jgi:glycosyltransferase involved in cell wall biosynthesis
MSPLLSVIVPCFNYARYLPDCVNSLLGQRGIDDFELILIDDASSDETAAIMRSYTDPRIRTYFHEKNAGHVRTMTEGLLAARGELVARIDPDDRVRPDFFSQIVDTFRRFPDVGLVYGDVSLIDSRGNITLERADAVHGGRDFKGHELIALMKQNFICAPTVFARRQAWLDALPVPDHLAFNDWYFTLMIARRWEFYYIDRVLAEYRVHDSNHHTKIAKDKSEERSVFWLLDYIYSGTEPDAVLERAKQAARGSVYAAQYVTQGDKYFGFGLYADARRCYLSGIRARATEALTPGVCRRLLATYIGRKAYESMKGMLRGSAPVPTVGADR